VFIEKIDRTTKSFCDQCKTVQLRRKPRKLMEKILSIYPYKCGRCRYEVRRFHLTPGFLIRTAVLALLVGGGIFYLLNPTGLRFGNRAVAETTSNNTAALAAARTAAGGQLSTFEQMMLKRPRGTLDNATVLKLWKANVSPNVILQMIRASSPDYDLSANAIIELRQANVDQTIILAMIEATNQAK